MMPLVCPICENETLVLLPRQAKDYITGKSFSLQQCNHCKCVVTADVELAAFEDSYGDIYYNSSKGKFSPLVEKIFKWNHKRNARLLQKRFNPQSILEIGCGRAYLLKELKALGVNVCALESAAAADWILYNDAVEVVKISEDSSEWPFPSSSFQFVIYWHVFEHIANPIASLEQAQRVLAEDGILCVSVPNVASYQARIGLTTWFHLDVPRHLFHFSKKGIIQLLEQRDFEIVKVCPGDGIQNLYGWFQSLANIFTKQELNGLYRLLQGGKPLKTASKTAVLVQVVTVAFWLPLGLLGYLVETVTGNHGTVTIYARNKGKKSRGENER